MGHQLVAINGVFAHACVCFEVTCGHVLAHAYVRELIWEVTPPDATPLSGQMVLGGKLSETTPLLEAARNRYGSATFVGVFPPLMR